MLVNIVKFKSLWRNDITNCFNSMQSLPVNLQGKLLLTICSLLLMTNWYQYIFAYVLVWRKLESNNIKSMQYRIICLVHLTIFDSIDVKTRPEFHPEIRGESCGDHLQGKFIKKLGEPPSKMDNPDPENYRTTLLTNKLTSFATT